MKISSILAIDIGGGTQDILLYDPEQPLENAVKLVLPSPTVIAARRIARATDDGKPVFLSGKVMGGGAVSRAVRNHIAAGFSVFSLESPALSIHDNLSKVEQSGVQIVTEAPDADFVEVVLGDVDVQSLEKALNMFEVDMPEWTALALQDHGFSPNASNRLTRFSQWQRFLDAGGDLGRLLFKKPPDDLSRWIAAADILPDAYFMDTSSAALRGAVLDDYAREKLPEGLLVINAGNEHTVAFLVKERRVWGVYEHHTSLLTQSDLKSQMERFSAGTLTNREIFDQWGHGVGYQPGYKDIEPISNIVVTGPRRRIARDLGRMAAPYGEMMLSGCFGLITAVAEELNLENSMDL